MEKRMNWDEYFMRIALLTANRATCIRRKVGAVIVKDNRIIATGYNGAPKGIRHCTDINECLREKLNIPSGKNAELCIASHAENNAIIQCALSGTSPNGATIYVTTSPCSMCLKTLINAGIKRIVTLEPYPDDLSTKLIKESEIEYEYISLE